MKAESNGAAFLTDAQRAWLDAMRLMLSSGPVKLLQRPAALWRRRCFALVELKGFEMGIMGAIVLNAACLSMRYRQQSFAYLAAVEAANEVFTAVFVLEALLKLAGLGPVQYWARRWNRFDLTIVGLGLLGSAANLGQLATLLRIFRVARVFRLIRTSKVLMSLFKTLVYSLPSLFNVGAIMGLVMFIFTVLGMNLFSDVKTNDAVKDHANFGSFGVAWLTLFRCITGENFNQIMHNLMLAPPYCDPETNCGLALVSPLYFVLYVAAVRYVMLNLLIAVVLDNFIENAKLEASAVSDSEVERFQRAWVHVDPAATGVMWAADLGLLLRHLEYPLGAKDLPAAVLAAETARAYVLRVKLSLRLNPALNAAGRPCLKFTETINELTKRAFGEMDMSNVEGKQIFEGVKSKLTAIAGSQRGAGSLKEHLAASMLQAAFRRHSRRGGDASLAVVRFCGVAPRPSQIHATNATRSTPRLSPRAAPGQLPRALIAPGQVVQAGNG
jgi:hypothetical protein